MKTHFLHYQECGLASHLGLFVCVYSIVMLYENQVQELQ